MSLRDPTLQDILRNARPPPAELTRYQRVGLACDTALDAEFTTSCEAAALTAELLVKSGLSSLHVFALDLGVETLVSLGFGLAEIRQIGCDCLDLVMHPAFAEQLVARFGPLAVREALLTDGVAAVAMTGEAWLRDLLFVDADALLQATVGNIRASRTVVRALAQQNELTYVSPDTFTAAGLQRREIPLTDRQLMRMRPTVESARALRIY